MVGIKSLRKIQLGRETTSGTAVAATTIWRGRGVIEDQRDTVFVEEDIGYLSGVDRSYQPKLFAALGMESIEATFEQLPHIFEAGIKTATPAQDDTGSGYLYVYAFPTTAANTIKTYTLEGGDNQEVEEIEYAFVEKFTLSGKAGEALMVSADYKGRQATVSAFTTTATLPTVEDILFSKGKLYIDNVADTFGSTQVSNSLLEFSADVTTGWMPVWTADGALYFSFAKQVMPEITGSMTFEHDGSSTAEKVLWRAQTPRLVRLIWEGTALTTAGNYTYKTLILDMAIKWEKFNALGDQDGNDIIQATFRARYNATAADFANITVVNELTTLP